MQPRIEGCPEFALLNHKLGVVISLRTPGECDERGWADNRISETETLEKKKNSQDWWSEKQIAESVKQIARWKNASRKLSLIDDDHATVIIVEEIRLSNQGGSLSNQPKFPGVASNQFLFIYLFIYLFFFFKGPSDYSLPIIIFIFFSQHTDWSFWSYLGFVCSTAKHGVTPMFETQYAAVTLSSPVGLSSGYLFFISLFSSCVSLLLFKVNLRQLVSLLYRFFKFACFWFHGITWGSNIFSETVLSSQYQCLLNARESLV